MKGIEGKNAEVRQLPDGTWEVKIMHWGTGKIGIHHYTTKGTVRRKLQVWEKDGPIRDGVEYYFFPL